MGAPDQYVALVASLPGLERLFFAKQPPLSRLRLEKRLQALTSEHAAVLATVENLLSWGAYAMSVSGPEAIARIDRGLATIPQPTLQAIVRERVELRVVVAALRRRAAGDGPSAVAPWGRWARRVAENWTDPSFGLSRRHLWLPKAASLVAQQDPKGLERRMLEVTFRQLQRHGAAHLFDFEAVAIYVLKWSIFDRWARLNAEAAVRRFTDLADAALAAAPDPRHTGGSDVAVAG